MWWHRSSAWGIALTKSQTQISKATLLPAARARIDCGSRKHVTEAVFLTLPYCPLELCHNKHVRNLYSWWRWTAVSFYLQVTEIKFPARKHPLDKSQLDKSLYREINARSKRISWPARLILPRGIMRFLHETPKEYWSEVMRENVHRKQNWKDEAENKQKDGNPHFLRAVNEVRWRSVRNGQRSERLQGLSHAVQYWRIETSYEQLLQLIASCHCKSGCEKQCWLW